MGLGKAVQFLGAKKAAGEPSAYPSTKEKLHPMKNQL